MKPHHILLPLLPLASLASGWIIDSSCDDRRSDVEAAIEDMNMLADEAIRHLDHYNTRFGEYYKDRENKRQMTKTLKQYFSNLFGDHTNAANRDAVKANFQIVKDSMGGDQTTKIYCTDAHLRQLRYIVNDDGTYEADDAADSPESDKEGKRQYMWVDPNLSMNVETSYHDEISKSPCSLEGIKAVTYQVTEEEANAPLQGPPTNSGETPETPLKNVIIICPELYNKKPYRYSTYEEGFGEESANEIVKSENAVGSTFLHEAFHTYTMGAARCPGGGGNEFYNLEAIPRQATTGLGMKNADSYAVFAAMCYHNKKSWSIDANGIARKA